MRNGIIAITAALSVIGGGLMAAEIDSPVIHNYNYFAAGYGFLSDIADSDIDAHGVVGDFSFEEGGFLIGVDGGYFWATDTGDADVNLWNVKPRVGYVLRLLENHLNIIPNVAGEWSGIELDDPVFGSDSDDTWSIFPGIGLSYAINNRFALNGSYAWGYNFDSEDSDHFFTAGGKFALFERVGLAVNGLFREDFGFTGVTAVVEFHY
jgi:hypothetical protein